MHPNDTLDRAALSLAERESYARKVVVYERVSTDKQDLTRQEAQRQHAAREFPDAEVVVVQDDGVSAYKVSIFKRPGGQRLVKLIEDSAIVAVFADAQDRLSRGKQSEWWQFVDLCELTETRIFIEGREIKPWADEGDEMKSALDAMIARRESRHRSHRTRTGIAAAAKRGRPNGGPRRYGFDRADGTLVARPDEVAVVAKMFELARTGMSQTGIARTLNDHGHRTAGGHAWSQPKVGQVLRDPIWVGKLVNAEGTFQIMEPVIDAELWHAVQRTFGHSGARSGKPSERFLLSHGLLRCGHCGYAMRVKSEKKDYGNYDHYSCSGRRSGATDCKQPAVRRELIDEMVLEYFAHVGLDVDATVAQLATDRDRRLQDVDHRLATARKVLSDAQRQQERLDGMLREGLTVDEWRQVSAVPQKEAEAAALAIADLTAEREQVVAMGEDLSDATSEFIERIAQLRAAVAGEVVNAQDVAAAQAALRRVFDGFVLIKPDRDTPPSHAIQVETGGDTYETVVYYELKPLVRGDALTPVPLSLPDGAFKDSSR